MADASPTRYLTLTQVKKICFALIKRLLEFEEPVPEFETRFPEKLESILEIPRQTFGGEELYPTIFEKAACYFYFTIKNHPFLNGNKRMAIVTTYVFLRINEYILDVPLKVMYDYSVSLAKSTENHKREFREVVAFMQKYSKKKELSN